MIDETMRRKRRRGALTETDMARSGLLGMCECMNVDCGPCYERWITGVRGRNGVDPHDRHVCDQVASAVLALTYIPLHSRVKRTLSVCSACADCYTSVSTCWERTKGD